MTWVLAQAKLDTAHRMLVEADRLISEALEEMEADRKEKETQLQKEQLLGEE